MPTLTKRIEQLTLQCSEWGLELDPLCLPLLAFYAESLASYSLANVIGTKDVGQIVSEHILDSLSCLTVDRLGGASTLVDVGTGGGLPGVPLAIARPALSVTLLEATEKKVRFLEEVGTKLQLKNVKVLQVRAEDLGRMPEYRHTFDLATARALSALPVVVEYCAPLVRLGGQIVSMKASLREDELLAGVEASKQLGAHLKDILEVKYRAPLPQKKRRLVVFDKVADTSSRFPRKVGMAKKRPLGAT